MVTQHRSLVKSFFHAATQTPLSDIAFVNAGSVGLQLNVEYSLFSVQ